MFPGTIGIFHVVSNQEEGREWAHPFIGCDFGKLAYVCKRARGIFILRTLKNMHNEIANIYFFKKGINHVKQPPNSK